MTIKHIAASAILLFLLTGCAGPSDDNSATTIAELRAELAQTQEELAATEAAATSPGLIHNVFVWLKEDLTEEQREDFRAGVESLRAIASVREMHVGPVAPTEARGVVDNTFSIALAVHFDDVAGQDAYQIDPIHLKFVADHQDKWTKVLVYDNLVEE